MLLENVFYGFTKDGKYRLLWKKLKTVWTSMGDVTTVVYYDLKEKKKFERSQVYEKTLQPITIIVGNKRWTRRKKVKSRNLYPKTEKVLKGVWVRETHPIRTDHFDDVVGQKRKILEMDYRKEL